MGMDITCECRISVWLMIVSFQEQSVKAGNEDESN